MAYIPRPSNQYGQSFGRTTTLIAPPAWDPAIKTYPLLLLFPVYGEIGAAAISRLQLQVAPQFDDGAFIFAPTGIDDGFGQPYWRFFQDPTLPGSDGDFVINGLARPALADAWGIDPKQVFAMGLSNGGLFVNRLCEFYPDVVRSMVSISGPTSPNSAPTDPPQLPLAHSVPALIYGSPIDNIVLYGGGNGSTLPGNLAGHPYQGELDAGTTHNNWNGGGGVLGAFGAAFPFTLLPTGNNCQEAIFSAPNTPQTRIAQWQAVTASGHPSHNDTLNLISTAGTLLYQWCRDHHNDF